MRCLIIPALLLAATSALAQTGSFSDNFDLGNIDNWDTFDIIGDICSTLPPGAVPDCRTPFGEITFPDGGVRLQVDATPSPDFGLGRIAIGHGPLQVTDFQASVDVVDWANTEASPNNVASLLARTREGGPGTTDGYLLFVNNVTPNDAMPEDSQVVFGITRFDDEVPVVDLANEIVTLAPTRDFRLEFSGVGDELSGRLIALDDMTTLSTITANDGTYPSGGFALGASGGGMDELGTPNLAAGGDVTFDNFVGSGTLVPEPSAFGLVTVGFLAIIACRRRSRAR